MPNTRDQTPGQGYRSPILRDIVFVPPTQWLLVPVGIVASPDKAPRNESELLNPFRGQIQRREPIGGQVYHVGLWHLPEYLQNRLIVMDLEDSSVEPFAMPTKVNFWLTAENKEEWDAIVSQNGLPSYANLLVRFEKRMEEKQVQRGQVVVLKEVFYKLVEVRLEPRRAARAQALLEPPTLMEAESVGLGAP